MSEVLRVSGLTKQFGERRALDNVSFSLPEGAFLSVFGPNGAGKTTLLRILSTVARPSAGSARVLGFDLQKEPDQVRSRIGLISHEPMLYPDLSAHQNLMLFANLYGVRTAEGRVMELLEAVGLKHRRLDVVRGFSRGMTQRLAMARALLHDPQLVFLDEPYAGLDPHAVAVFDQLIDQVRVGRTFVMVSHDLEKGYGMCTHELLLSKGRVVSFAPKEELSFDAFSDLYAQAVGRGVS